MSRLADRLEPIFRRFGVRFAYLWGSRARGRARPDSDYDFAVDLPLARREIDRLLDLIDALCAELGTEGVDVTLLKDANPEVRFLVQHTGELLYEEDAEARRRFEHHARVVYWDEAIRLRRYDRAMRRRIREGTFAR